MIRRILISMGLIALLVFTQITTVRASDVVLTHQGRLLDASDHPVNGTVSITFKIYEAPTGGSPLWSEPHPTVSVQDGLFTEQLGELVPLSIDVLSAPSAPTLPRYLEIEVSGEPLLPRVKLASTPQAAVSGRVSGDISTGPGTAKLVGRSGSTTGTIRMAATPDSTGTTLGSDSNGDGIPESSVSYKTSGPRAGGILSGMSGSTTGTIRMAASPDSTSSGQTTDTDGDGIPEISIQSKTTPVKSTSILGGHSGSTTGTIRMAASPDSTSSGQTTDTDGDGTPESAVNYTTGGPRAGGILSGHSGSTTGTIRMAASPDSTSSGQTTDTDGDGIPESAVNYTTGGPRAGGILSGHSGSTTGTIRMAASPDSSTSSVESDITGDGVPESLIKSKTSGPRAGSILSGHSGSTTGTIRMVAATDSTFTITGTDSDGDGVAESSVIQKSKGSQANSILSGHNGSTTGTIRMQAAGGPNSSSSGELVMEIDGAPKMSIRCDSDSSKMSFAGGAYCDGTNWVNASDANSKENFSPVDGREILEKLNRLQITRWNYKGRDKADHIGPTAQDFHATFGVGHDDHSISTIDPSGIALAAIQALNQKLTEQLTEQAAENQDLRAQIAKLREMIRAQANKQK